MMDSIIIKFSDLKKVVDEMSKRNFDFIEVNINEGEPLEEGETYADDPDYVPPCLYLSARDRQDTFIWTDYDIEAVLEDID